MHIKVTQYFYALQNNHHNKFSSHLSLYKVIILLMIFPTLYATFPLTPLCVTGKAVPLNLPHLFLSSYQLPPPITVSLFLFCFSFSVFYIPHVSETIQYLSFSYWLIPLSKIQLGPSMLSQMQDFISALSDISLYVYHIFLYIFIYQWTLELLPYLVVVNSAPMSVGLYISFQ